MDIRAALKSQYHAALKVLRDSVEKCPEALWTDSAEGPAFWRVAYHTLFYAHLYLQPDEASFKPWERHREEADHEPDEARGESASSARQCEPYTRDDVLEYWSICDGMVDGCVDALDLDAAQCGFYWYSMPKLEHQLMNIRHIQHHAAMLSSRLRRRAGVEIGWVGQG